ncbi:MAG: hypothetical protein GY862_03705, partial [Gammaproteobacteria bacterium]|nr:hypothetical protein [Gammaproteobacteria bacterium]
PKPKSKFGAAKKPPDLAGAMPKPKSKFGAAKKPPDLAGAMPKPKSKFGAAKKPPDLAGAMPKPKSSLGAAKKPPGLVGAMPKPKSNLGAAKKPPGLVGAMPKPKSRLGAVKKAGKSTAKSPDKSTEAAAVNPASALDSLDKAAKKPQKEKQTLGRSGAASSESKPDELPASRPAFAMPRPKTGKPKKIGKTSPPGKTAFAAAPSVSKTSEARTEENVSHPPAAPENRKGKDPLAAAWRPRVQPPGKPPLQTALGEVSPDAGMKKEEETDELTVMWRGASTSSRQHWLGETPEITDEKTPSGSEPPEQEETDALTVMWKRAGGRRESTSMPSSRQARSPESKSTPQSAVSENSSKSPHQVARHIENGWVAVRKGEYREALAHWKIAMDLEPEHPNLKANIERIKRRLENDPKNI